MYSFYGSTKKQPQPELNNVFVHWVQTQDWVERINVCKHEFITEIDKSLRKLEKYLDSQEDTEVLHLLLLLVPKK